MSITRVQHPDPVVDSLSKHIAHMLPSHRAPTPPGQMLLRQFLEPSGLTQADLARRIGVSYPRVNELVNGKRSMTPDTALRLARLFDTSVEFWLTCQMLWDLWHVIHSPIAADIEKIEPFPVLEDEDEHEFVAVSEQTAAD